MNLPIWTVMLVAVFLTTGCGLGDSLRSGNSNIPQEEEEQEENRDEGEGNPLYNPDLPEPPTPDLPAITPT
ncbi:MAG: hypothetical protein ACRC6I_04295 [Paracoccaceae bacterium]